jgi:hypothetical protein
VPLEQQGPFTAILQKVRKPGEAATMLGQAQAAAQPRRELPPPTRQRALRPPAHPGPALPRRSPALQTGSRRWWSMPLPTPRWLCLTCRQPRMRCAIEEPWSASCPAAAGCLRWVGAAAAGSPGQSVTMAGMSSQSVLP